VGVFFIACVMYFALTASVFTASVLLLRDGITPRLPWVTTVQEHVYYEGFRRIWPAVCSEFDPQLIYRPRLGACEFDNPEFRTLEHFEADGRDTGPKPPGVGIAVVGDSHAMGWGVNDADTFAAHLQQLTRRPVYNLAVSSYATARELIRLDRSGLLDRVDTVIIQYCGDNDLEENREFRVTTEAETRKKFQRIGEAAARRARFQDSLGFLSDGYWFAVNAPIVVVKHALSGGEQAPSFAEHYAAFLPVVARHRALETKRVIVFYSNAHGTRFRHYPVGRDQQLPYVEFIDVVLDSRDYYSVDGHPNAAGHQAIARQLYGALRRPAVR
jgi:lysophospholipase L1-like esterase